MHHRYPLLKSDTDTAWMAQADQLDDQVRELRLRWFGHVQWKDRGYIGQKMLNMELPDRRRRGRQQRRFIEVV